MRLDNLLPIVNSDFLITVEGLSSNGSPVYFTTFSGVKMNRASAEFNDGLSNVKRYVDGGSISYQNVTISKPHDPEKDIPVLDFLKEKQDGSKFNVRLRPVKKNGSGNDAQMFRGNRAWDLTGCDLVSYTLGENIDTADGTQTVMLSVEFRVEQAEFK